MKQENCEPQVDCQKLEEKCKVPLELFLEAVSLGMNDREIAAVTGLELQEVKELRDELGGVGSNLDVTHKKGICRDSPNK